MQDKENVLQSCHTVGQVALNIKNYKLESEISRMGGYVVNHNWRREEESFGLASRLVTKMIPMRTCR